jgi:hypothetical protein
VAGRACLRGRFDGLPRNNVVLKRGKPYHYMKVAFERFCVEKIKRDLPSMHFGW